MVSTASCSQGILCACCSRTLVYSYSNTRALLLAHACVDTRTRVWFYSHTRVYHSRVRRCIKSVPYFAHYRILNFFTKVSSACLPANRDRPSAYTIEHTAFKFHENKSNFCRHKPLLFRLQYSPCTIVCPLFIHSTRLIFLLETNVLTFHKGVDIQ